MLNEQENRALQQTLDAYRQAGRVPEQARIAAAIDVLMVVQQRRGWLTDEMLQELAQRLALSVESLEGLATFYNRLFRRPVGRHRIWYCDSVSCWLMGCERLREQLQQQLGIAPGETTADGRFTLLPTVCLGVCDQAPVLAIDDDLYPATDTMELSPLLEAYD